jgi:hypothetical protein
MPEGERFVPDAGGGMHEDDRTAPVEFGEHRTHPLIADVDPRAVGHQDDAVRVQVIEGVRDLLERAVDIRQRQQRELAEAVRISLPDPGTDLVDLAGQRSGRRTRRLSGGSRSGTTSIPRAA